MIRKARPEDKFDFILLCKMFSKESKYPFKLDLEKLYNSFDEAINRDDFCVFVYEVDGSLEGMLVGASVAPLFSKDKVATELAWYMNVEHRDGKAALRLLKAYEDWAKKAECKFVTMIDIDTLEDLHSLYERKGYTLTEKTYVKEI